MISNLHHSLKIPNDTVLTVAGFHQWSVSFVNRHRRGTVVAVVINLPIFPIFDGPYFLQDQFDPDKETIRRKIRFTLDIFIK
jgi:hypothetical protein